jgi:hypothetical protein
MQRKLNDILLGAQSLGKEKKSKVILFSFKLMLSVQRLVLMLSGKKQLKVICLFK